MFFRKEDNSRKRAKESKAYDNAIPQSITDSIPYVAVYESGIIEVKPGVFSQSYLIPAVNFKTTNDNDQWRLAEMYAEFMNSFDSGVTVQITIYNRTIDMDAFREKVFVKIKDDDLNEYREEYERNGMRIAGTSPDGRLVEAVEIPDHPFFLGVQFHPEFKSRPNRPHPCFTAFIEAALKESHREL